MFNVLVALLGGRMIGCPVAAARSARYRHTRSPRSDLECSAD